MFRQLAAVLAFDGLNNEAAANAVLTRYRPSQISEYLERFWGMPRLAWRAQALGLPGGDDLHRQMARPGNALLDDDDELQVPEAVGWPHLAYAALLTQSRLPAILERVAFEWLHGERLPRPSLASQRWLHVTEQLFMGNSWPYSIRSVTSALRQSADGVRRNAMWRMFAWDLPPSQDGQTAYVRAEAANVEFTLLFEALLAEVWRAYVNVPNISGANESDLNAIDNLIRRIREILSARRFAGSLSREEFEAVAWCDWLYLTIEYETQIVEDLGAQGGGVADRLRKIGDLVGIPAHSRADAFFQLAENVSAFLLAVESGAIQDAGGAGALLQGDAGDLMLNIMTHWTIATGHPVKDPAFRASTAGALASAGLAGIAPSAAAALVRA